MFFQNASQLRAMAKSLHKSLKAKFPELTQAEILEALAHTKGYANWAALKDSLSPQAIAELLSDMERDHAHDAQEADVRADESGAGGYGDETALQVHTGFFLKAPAYPQDCDYVRVCDPVGREVAYWVSDEWAQSPAEVMGAVIGALTRGKGLTPRQAKDAGIRATAPVAVTLPAARVPSIRDVDFMKTHFVALDGQGYRIEWREEPALKFIGRTQLAEYEDWEDETALQLFYDDDGLIFQEWLTVGQLSALVWDESADAFKTPDGSTVTFYQEEKFSARRAPADASVVKAPLTQQMVGALQNSAVLRLPSAEAQADYDLLYLVPAAQLETIRERISAWIAERREHFHQVQAGQPLGPDDGDWTAEDVNAQMQLLGAQPLQVQEGPRWD